jgi:hypothetical protein
METDIAKINSNVAGSTTATGSAVANTQHWAPEVVYLSVGNNHLFGHSTLVI